MKKIDLNDPKGPNRITMMVTGASRSGKTYFAARFPRPVFLSDASESGWTTIQNMHDDAFYEKGRVPEVYAIEKPADMMDSITDLEERIGKDRSAFGTIVVDSLTFYAEMYFAQLEALNQRLDTRKAYGDLASHLRWMMIRIHRMPVNVLWLALTKEGGEEGALGGLSIPGQTATKAPARCDIWAYMEQVNQGNRKPSAFRLHTRNYGGFKAGHRFGDVLPGMLEDPSYFDLEDHLQLQPWLERFDNKTKKQNPKPTTTKK
jgi:adenosyl cobinamide kinase/adenosyl cobinamide phosphate guanylyltransferase